jgi:nucleoside recognition membrane protein YjiH
MVEEKKVGIGAYIALILAIIFFSGVVGMLDIPAGFKALDFSTLNGKFGSIEAVNKMTTFRGSGGVGAKDGFMFALNLLPTVIFALAMVEVASFYGALDAARVLLTPILKPVLGLPGSAGLTLIAALQSTDAGAGMTKALYDSGEINDKQRSVFCAFQFSAGATITNVFASGAVLYALMLADGELAMKIPLILPLMVIFTMKFVGANIMRLYLSRK